MEVRESKTNLSQMTVILQETITISEVTNCEFLSMKLGCRTIQKCRKDLGRCCLGKDQIRDSIATAEKWAGQEAQKGSPCKGDSGKLYHILSQRPN